MHRVIELVWFHIKSDVAPATITQALDDIKDELISTPGLDAVFYGKGTTIPQGFVGMNIIKVWSSTDAQRVYFKSPVDHEYKIARHIIDASNPTRPPNSVSFLVLPSIDIDRALTAPVTLLSCIWIPHLDDKETFDVRKQKALSEQGPEFEHRIMSSAFAWSVSGSTHPTVGAIDGLLSLTACDNVSDATTVANGYKQALARFSIGYEPVETSFSHTEDKTSFSHTEDETSFSHTKDETGFSHTEDETSFSHTENEHTFRNNKLKLKGKGIFYTIEVTKHAYAWIARHGAGTSTSTANTSQDPAGTINPTEQASVLGLTSDFERLGGTWNAEKAKEYDKDEAKALFYITNSLLDDDDALADEYETASALWTALKKDEKDVDYTWAKLKEYRRKIIAAKPAAKGLYNNEALLQIILRALPEGYGSVIDYLDVQTSLTVDEKIAALCTKELRLNDTAEYKLGLLDAQPPPFYIA
ncbi:hypothetical protein PTMSG1_01410 [Pyrenophora teres f. maculata]|nr:hypothetical protein PTMSG1_01410 [Pyrenophora teres f. maculata]